MQKIVFEQMLTKGLQEFGLDYNVEKADLLYNYMSFLLQENKKYNLTAIKEPEEIVVKHFFDSLCLLLEVNINRRCSLIDVGTGAGFPGLVLKIFYPSIKLVLLDSLAKRITFLNKLIERLNLQGIETIHSRSEEIGKNKSYRGKFDYVVSRAVASINILSEYTIPLAKIGGTIIFYKGPDYLSELKEGEQAISLLGGRITEVKQVKIPELKGDRYLIIIDKFKDTPPKYPRRPGMPKKHPL